MGFNITPFGSLRSTFRGTCGEKNSGYIQSLSQKSGISCGYEMSDLQSCRVYE